jgi:hypothetical protein
MVAVVSVTMSLTTVLKKLVTEIQGWLEFIWRAIGRGGGK